MANTPETVNSAQLIALLRHTIEGLKTGELICEAGFIENNWVAIDQLKNLYNVSGGKMGVNFVVRATHG